MHSIYTRPAILIAGPAGSYKTTLAKDISAIYTMPRFSIGDQWKKIYQEKLATGEIRPNTSFPYFWTHTTVEENKKANDQVIPMVLDGNVVVDLRYPFMYRELERRYYTILMNTSLERRIEGARENREYRGMSVKGIRRRLARRERDEVRMGKELSRRYLGEEIDFRDPKHYDIVVPADELEPTERLAYVISRLPEYEFGMKPVEAAESGFDLNGIKPHPATNYAADSIKSKTSSS